MKRSDNGKGRFGLTNSDSDAAAWTVIAERYRRLLIVWAVRCPATAASGESAEGIDDQALTRAWSAISPKGFGSFPNLAAFLSYLHMCVTHVAIVVRAFLGIQYNAGFLSQDRGSTEEPRSPLELASPACYPG